MKQLFALLILFSTINLFGQDIPDSLLKNGWNMKGVIGVNISQTAFSNWALGGSNSLAYSAFTNLSGTYFDFPWKWKNRLNLAYGRTKLQDVGYRTTDNDFYFESILSKNIGWAVDPYFATTVRSSITNGYDYTVTPDTQTVAFFDPGYVTEALGFTYDKNKIITSRFGIALQQTFANRFTKYTNDLSTPDKVEKFKLETGIESVTEVKYEFLPKMSYYGFLRLFTRFNHLDIWDVRWDNIITAQINDYVNVNLSVTVLQEVSQSRRTQLKEALQLGFSYNLF